MPTVAERFLADFHDRQPGGSSLAFHALAVTDDDGRQHASPYHALADRLNRTAGLPDGPVLDLACGDGYLLGLLGMPGQPGVSGRPRLGVDVSAGELAAARQRLGNAVPLHQARAQALPLADASVAVITCHMALMLMAEPDAVVAELRRVLQPGGRLLAVVPGAAAAPPNSAHPASPDPLTAAWLASIAGHDRLADWSTLRFEGRCWRDPAGLAALLQPAFTALHLTRLRGEQRLTPDGALAWFTGLYDLHLLPPAAWPAVEADFRHRLTPLLDDRGQVALPHTYLLIDATAAS
jgi:SAM-dependent methyltransferase